MRRGDIRKSFAQARYSPWPKSMGPVRRISLVGSIGYVENGARQLETRDIDGEFAVDFNTADRVSVGYSGSYELVPRPFRLATGVTVPMGGYDYGSTTVAFQAGQQRKLNGRVSLDRGSLYDGTKTTIGLQHRPRDAVAAALGRAHLLDQRRRFAAGLVRDDAGRLARDLHDDAADVRERAGAVQLRRPQRLGERPAPVGIPARAASCSSSTTRNATR